MKNFTLLQGRARSWLATLVFLMTFSLSGFGQTTINFDTDGNWVQDGATSLGSYGNHSFAESGLTIQGTNILRNGTGAQDGFAGALGTYSIRIRNASGSKAVFTITSGGINDFSFKIRRWDGSPIPDYTVKYSINGGSTWTDLANINGTLLTSSDWFTYSETINSDASSIQIEIANTGTTERIMIDDFTWTGFAGTPSPSITLSETELTGFTFEEGSGPSANQTFTVEGANLNADIILTASANYEISTDGSTFTTPITLTHSGGTVTSTTVYTRLKAGLSAGDYNGETIGIASAADVTKTVTCSGTVTPWVQKFYLAGDFNGWASDEMTKQSDLGTTTHKYTYLETAGDAVRNHKVKASDVNWENNWGAGESSDASVNTNEYHVLYNNAAPDGNGNGATGISTTTGKYYTVLFKDISDVWNDNSEGYIFETSAAPVTIDAVSQDPSADITSSDDITVTITTSAAPSDEKIYVRYVVDGDWSNDQFVLASFTDATGTATIPAQADGSTITYYVLSTGVADISNENDPDLATLNYDINGGSNYEYIVTDPLVPDKLIISQYYEEGSNKWIELTNIDDHSIDLSNYYVCLWSNTDSPSGSAGSSNKLTGTLAVGESLLLKNSGTTLPAYASGTSNGAINFNGNDAFAITINSNNWDDRVDCIYSSGTWGADKSFYRNDDISSPNTNISVLDGTGEWTEVALATVNDDASTSGKTERLGLHVYGVDNEAPVPTFSPADGETGVYISVNPTITFDEDVFKASDGSAFTEGEDVSGYFYLKETVSGTFLGKTATISGRTVTIVPDSDLSNDLNYTLAVWSYNIQDAAGNVIDHTIEKTFQTIDAATPYITDVAVTEPAPYYAGQQVTITWASANVTNVNVYVYIDETGTWDQILTSTASDGSEPFTIPANASYDLNYKLKVEDALTPTLNDESSSFEIRGAALTIAELRSNHAAGDIVRLNGDAIVTWVQSYRNQKYIQDASAAILIDDNSGVITSSYTFDDQMTGLVGKLASYNGMLQFVPQEDPGAPTISGSITPEVVALADFLASPEDYQAELITIEKVRFSDADGAATYNNGTEYTLTNDTDNTIFRTSFYSVDYISTTLPFGYHDITGIVNTNNSHFISARDASEIVDNYGPIAQFDPVDGTSGFDPNGKIYVSFAEGIYKDALGTAVVEGDDLSSAFGFSLTSEPTFPPFTATFTNGKIEIVPSSKLAELTEFAIDYLAGNIYDVNGNANDHQNSYFTTGKLADVTLSVDMSNEFYNHAWDSTNTVLDVIGDFDGWSGTKLSDPEGDLIYSTVLKDVLVGESFSFKFRKNAAWDGSHEFYGGGDNRNYTVIDGTNNFIDFYNGETPPEEAEFLSFDLGANQSSVEILTADAKINVEMLSGTSVDNLTTTFTLSPGAQLSPTTPIQSNYSAPVEYYVSSNLGTVGKLWTVNVEVLAVLSSEAEITVFSFAEQTGNATINSTAGTVDIEVAYNAVLTSLTPTIGISAGATVNPLSGVAQDFSAPFVYTVQAEDGTEKEWTVNVSVQTVADVVFNVNMNKQANLGNFDPSTDGVSVAGSFEGWNGIAMSDDDTDLIYTVTVENLALEDIQFKFRYHVNGGDPTWEYNPNREYTVIDGVNEINVWFNNVELGTEATVESATYLVDNDAETITNVAFGTDLATFQSNVSGTNGATYVVYQADGLTVATDIQTDYVVKVSSEDGTANKTYTITVDGEVSVQKLIITQYYEGASNNKWIEITNADNSDIDLSNYYLGRWSGTETPSGAYTNGDQLSGTLAPGASKLYMNASSVLPTYCLADGTGTTACYFNGDDPVALMFMGDTWEDRIDCIYGSIAGGTKWGADQSFVRKTTVKTGNINISDLTGDGEWTIFTIDEVDAAAESTIERLGYHTFTNDTDAPVATFNPANNETSVLVATVPTITFNESVFKTADGGAFATDENVSSMIEFFETATPANTVSFTATIDGKVITITPAADLNHNTQYTIALAEKSVEDAAGNENIASQSSFTTIDANAPVISNVSLVETAPYFAGDNVTVQWYSSNITNVKIEVYVPSTASWSELVASVDATAGSKVISLPVDAVYGDAYQIRVSDASNAATNALSTTFEVIAVANDIASLRTAGLNNVVKLSSDAIVTWAQSYRGQKYIQDATAAILIDDAAGTISETYAIGDQITGLIGKLGEYGGMLQFVPQANPGAPTATGLTITPAVVSVDDFIADFEAYEAQLITFENVEFISANGTNAFANGKVYEISDGTDTTKFRTTFYDVDYIGNNLPVTTGNITGIANSRSDGNYISSRDASELVFALPSEDATLSTITVDGENLESFDAATQLYTLTLDYGTTEVPLVYGVATNENASIDTVKANTLNDTTFITVVAESLVDTLVYKVAFKVAEASSDATLSALTIDGTEVEGFAASTYNYSIVLPFGTTDIPVVAGTVSDATATKIETQATALPGDATIVVTAQDGTTKLTYTVSFTLADPSTDATLSTLTVNGTEIADFDAAVYVYTVELPADTTVRPTVDGVVNDTTATKVVTQASETQDSATVVVTAQDGETSLTYTVKFTVKDPEEKYTVTFNVKDDTDNPVVGAVVKLTGYDQLTTGADGVVIFTDVAPELKVVYTVDADGFNQASSTVSVINENVVENVTLVPETGNEYSVTFNIKNEAGSPISGAVVTFNNSNVVSDAEGKAVFTNVAPVNEAPYTVELTNYEVNSGTVTVTNADVDLDVVLIEVGVTLENNIVFKVYPNPTNGQFFVETDLENARLHINDISGRLVHENELTESKTAVNISEFKAGVYIINIITDNAAYQKQIVLQ